MASRLCREPEPKRSLESRAGSSKTTNGNAARSTTLLKGLATGRSKATTSNRRPAASRSSSQLQQECSSGSDWPRQSTALANFEQISRRAEASRGCVSAACVAAARGLGLDDVRSVPACTGSAGAWGSSVHRAVFLRQFAAQRRPSHSAGVDRPGWRPGRNRTAEQELGKNDWLGAAGRISGLAQDERDLAYFLPILCTNSRHLQTVQSNSKQLASFSRKEIRLKSASASKTRQIEVKGMNFGC